VDEIEAKVRCLEIGAALYRKHGEIPNATSVVEIARVMYDFVQAPPPAPETVQAGTTDKPQPGARPTLTRKGGKPDPFS
jgi:hypothetical protein